MQKKICKRCLIDELDYDKTYEQIKRLIASLPPESKVSKEVYQKRLDLCKGCDELENGICKKCGCFVELRAIKPLMYCASEDKKW